MKAEDFIQTLGTIKKLFDEVPFDTSVDISVISVGESLQIEVGIPHQESLLVSFEYDVEKAMFHVSVDFFLHTIYSMEDFSLIEEMSLNKQKELVEKILELVPDVNIFIDSDEWNYNPNGTLKGYKSRDINELWEKFTYIENP